MHEIGWTVFLEDINFLEISNQDVNLISNLLKTNPVVVARKQKLKVTDEIKLISMFAKPSYVAIDSPYIVEGSEGLLVKVTLDGIFGEPKGLPWHTDNPGLKENRDITYLYSIKGSSGSITSFNNNNLAFKDLENNPVYFNEKHKIPIKTIRMFTNLTVVEPVKFNDLGEPIGFVKPGNNHHIAIYENEKGKRFEKVVTFWEAVTRKREGVPVIDRNPSDGSTFITSMQQNEMFVFNMSRAEIENAKSNGDYSIVSKNLFRVRKLTSGNYWFNHHLETKPKESIDDKKAGRCIQASAGSFAGIKVRINHLGEITKIGE